VGDGVTAIDLFRGGVGGWSLALARLGVESIGIEIDRDSLGVGATREAAA
jgi:hypothetical protein